MYPKEMKPGLICNVLYSFFMEYVDQVEEANKLMKLDENNQYHVVESAGCLLNADNMKKKIEVIWGLNKELLAGVFVYLNVPDNYFNPKLNGKDLFFKKIYIYNRDFLEKIGEKVLKPVFPFCSFKNYKKKVVLIR